MLGSTPVLCACGCGQPVTLGLRHGQPRRFMRSHSSRINRRGYVRVRVNGESKQEHAVVAERALGKPLPMRAVVHHVNENRRNNANSNLVICQDDTYHKLLHARARVVRAGGNPNTEAICTNCKTVKPLDAFNRCTGNQVNGRQSACRECQKVLWAERAKKARAA